MGFQYKMVQVPPVIAVKEKEHVGNEAAAYLQKAVSANAVDGWEFYRIDSLGVQVNPGCLAIFTGKQPQQTLYYVITFRKAA